jgi:hypothetical protein
VQNLALLRHEGKGMPQIGGLGLLRLHPQPGTWPPCRIRPIVPRDSTKLTSPSLTGRATHGRG